MIKARPTTYRGIEMRSRLEADFARFLDLSSAAGEKWDYEPRCFAGPRGQYLPDFRLARADGSVTYYEIKPIGTMSTEDARALLRRMEVIFDSEPDVHVELIFWNYGTHSHGDVEGFHRAGVDDIWLPHLIQGGKVANWIAPWANLVEVTELSEHMHCVAEDCAVHGGVENAACSKCGQLGCQWECGFAEGETAGWQQIYHQHGYEIVQQRCLAAVIDADLWAGAPF